MILRAFVFPKLRTPKTWLDKSLKSPVSEYPSASNMVNVPKHCPNQHHRTLIIFIDCCQEKLSWKRSVLLTWKTLGLLLNRLAANENYLVLHRDNLRIPIQMQLSEKLKIFSRFFAAFLECLSNFEHLEQKDDSHRFCISEINVFKNVVR